MSENGRTHTPAVKALAERLHVDLDAIEGTGVGGRVTVSNVIAATPTPPVVPPAPRVSAKARAEAKAEDAYYALFPDEKRPEPTPPRVTASGRPAVAARSRIDSQRRVVIDAFGLNPLVEDAAQAVPEVYNVATKVSAPPTLFAAGDRPPHTASGLPPTILDSLPWDVRHYAAASPDRAEVLAMVEDFADPDFSDPFKSYEHQGRANYENRVKTWLSTSMAEAFESED